MSDQEQKFPEGNYKCYITYLCAEEQDMIESLHNCPSYHRDRTKEITQRLLFLGWRLAEVKILADMIRSKNPLLDDLNCIRAIFIGLKAVSRELDQKELLSFLEEKNEDDTLEEGTKE
jgi:hypothetical protein